LQLCYVDESGTAQTLLDTDPEPGVLRQITYDYVKGYLEFATAPRELHGLCLVAFAGRPFCELLGFGLAFQIANDPLRGTWRVTTNKNTTSLFRPHPRSVTRDRSPSDPTTSGRRSSPSAGRVPLRAGHALCVAA
jgi:hypothetical protein